MSPHCGCKVQEACAGAGSVIYNVTRRKNKRHGLITTAREVSNATQRLGDVSCLILRQRVRGSVRAVRNTQVFLTETRFVADEGHPLDDDATIKSYLLIELYGDWKLSTHLRSSCWILIGNSLSCHN
jgi:hypothetical protein